jgi:hypothetical protein
MVIEDGLTPEHRRENLLPNELRNEVQVMFFMVIEHYGPGKAAEVYRRFRDRGRMAPDGVRYISS